ncbi:MAG: polyprenyl diphosphate synthase, partial [archaeon]
MALKSIAFIPDGNRRYALKAGIGLAEAYKLGTEKAWSMIDWLEDYPSIKAGTFYTLSYENLHRTRTELGALFKIFGKELDKVFLNPIFERNGIRLKFIGRTNLLPKGLQQKLKKAEDFTEDFRRRTINLAIGYNGQVEILDAVKKLLQKNEEGKLRAKDLTPEGFHDYLYADTPDPDLIVRTSGT